MTAWTRTPRRWNQATDRLRKPVEEGDLSLVKDLCVGHPGDLIDSDADELPAGTRGTLPSVACDAMAHDLDAPQLLDVHVDELAGAISLVPDHRLLRLEALEPGEAVASQDTAHCGRGKAHSPGDLRTGVSPPT